MCLHVLGVNIFNCILVCFKLNVKYELIELGKGGTPDIPKSTWSMSKNKPSRLPTTDMCAEIESLGLLFITHLLGCYRD